MTKSLYIKFERVCCQSSTLNSSLRVLAHANAFLPGGVEETEQGLYEKVEPDIMMQHCVLAVMYASVADSQDAIRDASVMGFVYIAEVDEKKRRLKVLAPMNTRISERPMIWGSWPEAAISLMG